MFQIRMKTKWIWYAFWTCVDKNICNIILHLVRLLIYNNFELFRVGIHRVEKWIGSDIITCFIALPYPVAVTVVTPESKLDWCPRIRINVRFARESHQEVLCTIGIAFKFHADNATILRNGELFRTGSRIPAAPSGSWQGRRSRCNIWMNVTESNIFPICGASTFSTSKQSIQFFCEYLYLKGRATYLERSSLSKLTKPKCSWLRVNTTKYLKFIAITFVFKNNSPFSKKTTNDEFCFVAVTPQTNLRFLCTYCGFLPMPFFL